MRDRGNAGRPSSVDRDRVRTALADAFAAEPDVGRTRSKHPPDLPAPLDPPDPPDLRDPPALQPDPAWCAGSFVPAD